MEHRTPFANIGIGKASGGASASFGGVVPDTEEEALDDETINVADGADDDEDAGGGTTAQTNADEDLSKLKMLKMKKPAGKSAATGSKAASKGKGKAKS